MTAASGVKAPRMRVKEEQPALLMGQPSLLAAGAVRTCCWQTHPNGDRIASGRIESPLVAESTRRRHGTHGCRGRPLTWLMPAQGRIDVSVVIVQHLRRGLGGVGGGLLAVRVKIADRHAGQQQWLQPKDVHW